jgi:hypothetical protein
LLTLHPLAPLLFQFSSNVIDAGGGRKMRLRMRDGHLASGQEAIGR